MVSPTLPQPDAVARLLRDLFGRGVTPKKAAPPGPAVKVCGGAYEDDAGTLMSVCLCDLPLAASMGAALVLFPPGAAAEAVRLGKLTPEMFENLREVFNIMAGLFGGLHIRLREAWQVTDVVLAPVSALVARPRARLDLELAVAGYNGGRLSLLVA